MKTYIKPDIQEIMAEINGSIIHTSVIVDNTPLEDDENYDE